MIIGGGDCGTLREVLKHPGVQKAVQCDIDEQVTRMAEKYFPELCETNHDPRAELLFDDGIAYMANCAPGSLDIVIVDSTDPVGPGRRPVQQGLLRELLPRAEGRRHPGAAIGIAAGAAGPDQGDARRDGQGRVHHVPDAAVPAALLSDRLVELHAGAEGAAVSTSARQDARGKAFATKYYSADIHQGAAILPPFVAAALDR